MGVFIIVKSLNVKLDRRRKIIYGVCCICLIILAVIYFKLNSSAENIKVHNDVLTAQNSNADDREKKQGKLIYSLDNNAALKNPFSFAHETKAEINTAETISQNVAQMQNGAETQIANPAPQMDTNKQMEQIAEQPKTLPNFRLEAILDFNGRRIALIKLDELSYKVKRGDILAGFNVLEIGKRDILLLSDNGDLVSYKLSGF